jgi:predicted Zn finger-like uncharacterized protein
MILTCKECDTSFNFDERMLKASGSKVRCSKCRSVFTVYPGGSYQPAETAAAAATETAGAAAGAGLDDLDLNKIESMLDLEPDAGGAESPAPAPASQDEELNLDFNFDEEEPPVAEKSGGEFEETQELDFSDLDLDDAGEAQEAAPSAEDDLSFGLDLDDDIQPAGAGADESSAGGKSDDLDFELDLDLDDTPAAGAEAGEPAEADDLDFGLDLGLDEEPAAEPVAAESEAGEDLDFDLDLDLDEDKPAGEAAAPAGGEELDFSLDLDLDEEPAGSGQTGALDPDQTEELDLTDGNELLEPVEDEAAAGPAVEETDFELDLDSDELNIAQQDSEEIDSSQVAAAADLEFDLDLEEGGDEAEGNLEETAALDLDDLEETAEAEAEPDSFGSEEESFDLDLESALEPEPEEDALAGMEETEELDLSGLGDDLEIDAKSESGGASEDPLDLDLEIEQDGEESAADAGEFDLSDLDMVVEGEEEAPGEPKEAAGAEDFDIDLDLNDSGGGDTPAEEEDEDVEFDLSDLDDMLEIEEEPQGDSAAPAQDFDLQLDEADDTPAQASDDELQEAADVELEFEEDEDFEGYEAGGAPAERAGGGEDADFDMGDFSALEEDADEEAFLADEGEVGAKKPAKRPRKKMGGFFKFLLVLLLLGGGGYAGYSVAQFFGIDIPYLDRLKSVRIPYVSDFLGQEAADPGYLRIGILENDLNGRFVKNARLGDLFVISGNVKNNYDHSRNFITLTGKLYVKGRKLFSSQTVFAGNTLTDRELARFDQAAIDRFFKNRFGQKRANMNVKQGQVVPFMIVFSNLPKNLDEYTVEPAGSARARK